MAEVERWQRREAQPYEAGNTAALRHGVYSPRMIAERAERVKQHLLEVCPWLDDDRYMPAVAGYLRAVSRETMAMEAVERWDGSGRFPTKLLEVANTCGRTAWRLGDELGLSPAGHARLRTITAGSVAAEAGIADLIANGQPLVDRALSQLDHDDDGTAQVLDTDETL